MAFVRRFSGWFQRQTNGSIGQMICASQLVTLLVGIPYVSDGVVPRSWLLPESGRNRPGILAFAFSRIKGDFVHVAIARWWLVVWFSKGFRLHSKPNDQGSVQSLYTGCHSRLVNHFKALAAI